MFIFFFKHATAKNATAYMSLVWLWYLVASMAMVDGTVKKLANISIWWWTRFNGRTA